MESGDFPFFTLTRRNFSLSMTSNCCLSLFWKKKLNLLKWKCLQIVSSHFKRRNCYQKRPKGLTNEKTSRFQLEKSSKSPNSFECFCNLSSFVTFLSVPIATCNNLMFSSFASSSHFLKLPSLPLLFECSMKVHNLFPVTLLSWKIEIECDGGMRSRKRMQSTIVREKILKTHTHTNSDKLKVTMEILRFFAAQRSHTFHNEAT